MFVESVKVILRLMSEIILLRNTKSYCYLREKCLREKEAWGSLARGLQAV